MPIDKEHNFLTVMLLGRNKVCAIAECTDGSGRELISFLKESNPRIYTADGNVISDEDFERLV
jgi:hypothetical protein